MSAKSSISSATRPDGNAVRVAQRLAPECREGYLQRKFLELSLINRCLATPLDLRYPASEKDAIDQKFRLAAALRAERSLQSWAMTETARPGTKQSASGPFRFSFGYQRADLTVHGPAVYQTLRGLPRSSVFQKTIYTGSGMGAIAALLTSLLRLHQRIDVLTPPCCYGETRELMKGFGDRLGIISRESWRPAGARGGNRALRVLLLDSSVNARFAEFVGLSSAQEFDLVMFDTTCYWRGSSRIDSVVKWALRSRRPMALVRSHAKLDCLGIEYGRLGSIVLVAACDDAKFGGVRQMSELAREVRDSVRLFGAAPVPAHFPPFTGMGGYDECSIARTAAIMRNSRRLHECLARKSHGRDVMSFPAWALPCAVGGDPFANQACQACGRQPVRRASRTRTSGQACRLVRIRFCGNRMVSRSDIAPQRHSRRPRRRSDVGRGRDCGRHR